MTELPPVDEKIHLEKSRVEDPRREKLRRALKKEWRQRFLDKVDEVQDTDYICRSCLDLYGQTQDGLFSPICKGTCQIQQRRKDADGGYQHLSEEEVTLQKTMENPVSFAKLMFDWEARPYQEEMLLCSSKRKVVRAGRRIGKTECMAIKILHLMMTNPGFVIIVVCPYEYQVKVIFDILRKMIAKSEIYQNEIIRDVHDPHTLELASGSLVVGFTAGVKTGERANKVRGQGGNAIFLDEMDYLDNGSIESIMALYTDNKDVLVWASSTPTGKRELFFAWCMDKSQGYKEFHYTSRVSPAWDAETELFFLSFYSDLGFTHEFLAEFGESETAVFSAGHLDMSVQSYEYSDYPGPRTVMTAVGEKVPFYVMGVDWNSTGTGVHIVIIEYNPFDYKMRMVYKEIVNPGEFTQRMAMERIVLLNTHWNLDWIYVDAGFGTTQVETLHAMGMKYPKSGLHKKLKSIEMGGKTEIYDVAAKRFGVKVKKETKHLMVEIAARRVEDGQCIFPKVEERPGGLVEQLRNYEVKRYAVNGKPIYTDKNEHTAIAWMLAVFALIIEYTSLAKMMHANRIASVATFENNKPVTKPGKRRARAAATIVPSRAGEMDLGRSLDIRTRPSHLHGRTRRARPKPGSRSNF